MDKRHSHGERMWKRSSAEGSPRSSARGSPGFHRDVWLVTADRLEWFDLGWVQWGFLGFLESGEGPSSPHQDGGKTR